MEESTLYITENNRQLVITPQAQQFLKSAANWAKFLAIIGFTFVFIVAIGTYILTLITKNLSKVPDESQPDVFMVTTFLIIIFVVMTGFYFYALFKMLKFSNITKKAIRTNDSETLTQAFKYLNTHYKSMGIMMIACMILFILYGIGVGAIMIYGMGVMVNTF